jgi:hypothetical protein
MTKKKRNAKAKQATYRVGNWARDNKSLVQGGSITRWISEEGLANGPPEAEGVRSGGGPVQSSNPDSRGLLKLKAVYPLLYRQTVGLGQSVLDRLAGEVRVPDDRTRWKRRVDVLVSVPTRNPTEPQPMGVASTGRKIDGEGEWKGRQPGSSQGRTWGQWHWRVDPNRPESQAGVVTAAGVEAAAAGKQWRDETPGECEQLRGEGS